MHPISWKHATASFAIILCFAAPARGQDAVDPETAPSETPPPAPEAPLAPAEPADSAPADASCFPTCRPGYLCAQGQCVSTCNPACGDGEICMEGGECLPAPPANSTPPPAVIAPASVAPASVEELPPLKGPGERLVMPTVGAGWYGFPGFDVALGLGFGGERRWFYLEPSFRYGQDGIYTLFSVGGLFAYRGMNGSGRVRFSQRAGVDIRFTSVSTDGLADPYRDYMELIPSYGAGIAVVGESVTHILEVVSGISFVFSLEGDFSTRGVGSHLDLYLRYGLAF